MNETVAFFDTKPYDKQCFEATPHKGITFKYFDHKLTPDSAELAKGCGGVVAFVNDNINAVTINKLWELGVRVLCMRCAGYNNIDFKQAYAKGLTVLRVPGYSPNAVAEYAMAMLLTINRKIHKAYNRTREYNFTLDRLTGFDLKGKTVGVIGTGKIGREFMDICKGFKMNVLAYDLYPQKDSNINYTDLNQLFTQSHIISLHCPLTAQTHHIINEKSIEKMKDGVIIINTSRGAIIETTALLHGLKTKKIGGAGLDVYEEESNLFYEDFSQEIIGDDTLALLVSMPNVVVTSHQAFLTVEALGNIAQTTISNLTDFFSGSSLKNEICYRCETDTVSAT